MRIFCQLLLVIFVVGCGELETPKIKESDTFTSVLAPREPENFKPVFDEVKKRQVEIEIESVLNILDEESDEQEGEPEQDIIEKKDEHSMEQEELGPEFKEVGHYGTPVCPGLIFRKNFEVSYLYIFEDCKKNRTEQIVRK